MSIVLISYFVLSPIVLIIPTLLEIYVACKLRLKSSSFFYYFIARSVVVIYRPLCKGLKRSIQSLIGFCLYNVLWRLTLYPEFRRLFFSIGNGKWIHAPLLYLGVVHEFIMAFIAIDRVYVVVWDIQHKLYWKRLFCVAIPISILAPFLITWQLFFHDVTFVEFQLNNQFALILPTISEGPPNINLALNMTAVLLTNTVVSCGCYAISYIYFKIKWKNNNKAHLEMKFVWLALFSFISTLPLTIHQLIFAVKGNTLPVEIALALFEIMPWLVDLKYFAVIYIVFGMNKSFRNNCIKTVKRGFFHLKSALGISSELPSTIHVTSIANSRRTTTSQHITIETSTHH